ncbi:hypothetical protein [Spirosoma flavum]|uniref:Uncharacterized protein n=1 Tax=Spirosoma flavum TaxID=2048557 RepID=A0ABW6AS50_9BACT
METPKSLFLYLNHTYQSKCGFGYFIQHRLVTLGNPAQGHMNVYTQYALK